LSPFGIKRLKQKGDHQKEKMKRRDFIEKTAATTVLGLEAIIGSLNL
jgi:hypothetical protein